MPPMPPTKPGTGKPRKAIKTELIPVYGVTSLTAVLYSKVSRSGPARSRANMTRTLRTFMAGLTDVHLTSMSGTWRILSRFRTSTKLFLMRYAESRAPTSGIWSSDTENESSE